MSLSTPTADGGYVETYIDNSTGLNLIDAQKYDLTGQKVGAELAFGPRISGPYDVAALVGGGYALIYQSASPGGSWGEIRVQDAQGATIAQSSTAGGMNFHLIAGQDGGFLASYVGIPSDHGLNVTQPLVQLFDATGHSLTFGHIELAGQVTGVIAQAGGGFAVNWNDGATIRTLSLDPHTASSLSTPAMPTVTVLDDVGPQTGAVANGAITDDTTPTFRLSVSQVGEAFVELDKGTGSAIAYQNHGGGVAITAADVARGYIDITLPTSGDGAYHAWARVTDASGSASYPVQVDFNLQTLATAGAAAPGPDATTSVATLTYEFFTGSVPSSAGMDFLVSPSGPNPNNLNSAYYQSFNLENRYINFAVNLGKAGAGEASFQATYGGLSLFDATKQAYATIFGGTPSDAKVHALLDPTLTVNGQTLTRADYLAVYGGDGANGLGTKAAMVGWLLAEAEKAHVGTYALSNDAFLTDVALHNAPFAVDIVGHYAQAGFAFNPG